jgi:cytochrome c oxidase assembly protein subunit 15
MNDLKYRRALHVFAMLTAAATVVLICFGGLVTSHGAGLAVPDWPNSYGYNMFLFPISMWVGGIFYEHTHRLAGSVVGLLTLALAIWLWWKDSRRWLRWLGWLALLLVILQGVLGGLRVVLLKDQLGLVHGALAQIFLVLVAAIALFTSRAWMEVWPRRAAGPDPGGIRWLVIATTGIILVQLLLGAAMRHRHAGLAIPDFPMAHGRLWPATDRDSVARYNRERVEVRALNAVTAYDIHLQMAHRIVAAAIVFGIGVCVVRASRRLGRRDVITKTARLWAGLAMVQVALGAFTIWSGKAADIATAHVAVGSLTLCVGGLLSIVACRLLGGTPAADVAVGRRAWASGGTGATSLGRV